MGREARECGEGGRPPIYLFAAAVFAIDKEVLAAHVNLVGAVKGLVIGDFDGLDSHFPDSN